MRVVFLAGAIFFGDVGWSHLLLRPMQVTFSIICVTHRTVTLRGRRRIW